MGDIKPDSDLGSEQEGTPSQPGSQPTDDKPSSRLSEAARAEVSQIVTAAVEDYDNRKRSQKDRGVADANKTSKEALIAVEQLRDSLEANGLLTEELGSLLDKTKHDSEFRLLQDTVATLLKQSGGTPSEKAQLHFVGAFKEAGYDVDKLTPEDWLFASEGNFPNQQALEDALANRRLSPKTPANPSDVIQPGGGGSSSKRDLDAEKQKRIAEETKGLSAQARVQKINEIESEFNRLKAERS